MVVIRIWKYWMRAGRRLLSKVKKRQVNGELKKFYEDKETCRSILQSCQKHYPIKVLKGWCIQQIHGVDCQVMRLTGDKVLGHPANARYRNYVERSINVVKRYLALLVINHSQSSTLPSRSMYERK